MGYSFLFLQTMHTYKHGFSCSSLCNEVFIYFPLIYYNIRPAKWCTAQTIFCSAAHASTFEFWYHFPHRSKMSFSIYGYLGCLSRLQLLRSCSIMLFALRALFCSCHAQFYSTTTLFLLCSVFSLRPLPTPLYCHSVVLRASSPFSSSIWYPSLVTRQSFLSFSCSIWWICPKQTITASSLFSCSVWWVFFQKKKKKH